MAERSLWSRQQPHYHLHQLSIAGSQRNHLIARLSLQLSRSHSEIIFPLAIITSGLYVTYIRLYNDAWQYYISIKFVFQINSPKDELLFYKLSSSLCIFFKKNGRMMMFVEFQCFCQLD